MILRNVEQKKDKSYLSMKLVDKTGEIDAKVWDYPNGFDPLSIKKGDFIKVQAKVGEFAGQIQLNVSKIRQILIDEEVLQGVGVELGDFFKVSKFDPNMMMGELTALIQTNIKPPLMNLVTSIIFEHEDKFKRAPAAKGKHHAFLGGLLEHVLSMCRVALPICEHYNLDKSLVLSACVLHDIGKCWELTYEMGLGYSTEGTLIGHIPIGMQLVSDNINRMNDFGYNFPDRLKIELLHLIASHHGLLEWGSPKVPLMREAIVFHYIDMVDSRMGLCQAVLDGSKDDGDFTAFVSDIGGPLYKANIQGELE